MVIEVRPCVITEPLETYGSGRLMELYIGHDTDPRTQEAIRLQMEERGWRVCQAAPYERPIWEYAFWT